LQIAIACLAIGCKAKYPDSFVLTQPTPVETAEVSVQIGDRFSEPGELFKPVDPVLMDNRLYVLDTFHRLVSSYDIRSTFEFRLRFGGKGHDIGRFGEPVAVAVSGNHYAVFDPHVMRITEYDGDEIRRIVRISTEDELEVNGFAFEGNRFYLSEPEEDRIGIFDASGMECGSITYTGMESPAGLAIDTVTRRLFIAAGNQLIYVYDLDGAAFLDTIDLSGIGSLSGKNPFRLHYLDVNNGTLYVSFRNPDKSPTSLLAAITDVGNTKTVSVLTLVPGADVEVSLSDIAAITGITGNDSHIFCTLQADGPDGKPGLICVEVTTGTITAALIMNRDVSLPSIIMPNAVALDHDGNIYVANSHTNSIRKYDADGDYQYAVGGISGFTGIADLAVDHDGHIYVLDASRGLVILHADGEEIASLTPAELGTSITGFDVHGHDGHVHIMVADKANQRLVEVHFEHDTGGIEVAGEFGLAGKTASPVDVAIGKNGARHIVDELWRVTTIDSFGLVMSSWGDAPAGYDPLNITPHQIHELGHIAHTGELVKPVAIAFNDDRLFVVNHGVGVVSVFDIFGSHLGDIGTHGVEDGMLVGPIGVAVHGSSILVGDKPGEQVMKYTVTFTGENAITEPVKEEHDH
jgi:hemin uptake protein HemP